MSGFIMFTLVVNFMIISRGAAALTFSDGRGGVYEDLRWTAQLCCQALVPQTAGGLSEHPPVNQCHLHNATDLEPTENCLDVLCVLETSDLICRATSHRTSVPDVSPQKLVLQMDLLSNETGHKTQCSGEYTATCSISPHGADVIVSLFVSLSVNDSTALSPTMLINTHYLCSPHPPVNLYYNVTEEGEVVIRWNSTESDRNTISCEVRYSSNSSLEHWEVVRVKGRSWVTLDELSPGMRYMVQVRCQNSLNCWSNWSQLLYFTLDVSYIPSEVFATPGSEVTVYAVFHNRSWSAGRAVWMLNGQVKIPESQYRVINERVSAVTLRAAGPGFDSLMCCYPWGERFKCTVAYAKIYTEGMFNADISCQSKSSKVDTMTCEWNKSAWAEVRFMYRRYKSMCEDVLKRENVEDGEGSLVKECPHEAGDHKECTLSNLSLFSCYKMWLEVEGGRGKVRSFPVFVAPIDYVKPSPPSDLEAITLPNKTLIVKWRRPPLPVYDMQYELRFTPLHATANMLWEVRGVLEPQAEIPLEESCVQYEVEVRCKRLNGSGFWSNWSRSQTSVVYSRNAPEMGPDFWRIIQEDSVRNVTNVTLIFKPVLAGDPYSCVEGLVIGHQAVGGAVWANETTLPPFHSFQWGGEMHTVTVMSRNALGVSAWNRNITLLHQPKRRSVRSFSATANASCVHLSWTLSSDQPVPLSFVIEWLDLNKDPQQNRSITERIQWVRVQSTAKDLCICRRFYGSEEFILYPVFADGEGQPVRCTVARGDPAAYILLIIIAFLSAVLFTTLVMSQNQMKKLMWRDIPNPNNCSWAKGIDLRQIETMEKLFPHPEGLTACPLLLVSESICEVEIIDKPHPLTLECETDNEVLLFNSVDLKRTTTNCPLLGDSLEASSAAPTPETSGQSSVLYSNVLLSDQPGLLRKQQKSLSGSSDEGNFSANNSDISGSFPGGLWDLENHANPRHSSSYNSVEELSETSEQEYGASESTGVAKDLCYLEINKEEDDEENEVEEMREERDDNAEFQLCKEETLLRVDTKNDSTDILSNCASHSVPLYLPQFRTEPINPH